MPCPYLVKFAGAHLMTHKPKCIDCDACIIAAKMRRRPYNSNQGDYRERYKKFGDCVTIDHIDARGRNISGRGHQWAITIFDLGTNFLRRLPRKTSRRPRCQNVAATLSRSIEGPTDLQRQGARSHLRSQEPRDPARHQPTRTSTEQRHCRAQKSGAQPGN